jgi:DNA-binding response OmpR family regulator
MKILIIEDNPELSNAIYNYLSSQEYICEIADTYRKAMEKVSLYDYDCILLDITLPDGSGLSILEWLAKQGKQDGVIILSAKDSLDDKIKGLELGADDYLTKPFHLAELSMRVFSLIRRKQFKGNNLVKFEGLSVNLSNKTVTFNNKEVPQLTNKEFSLLLLFLSSPHRVLTKEAIAEHLLGDNADLFDNFDCVYAHIKNLKKKLKQADCTEYIRTMYGMGYKFSEE